MLTANIAEITKVHRTTISRRAKKEGWEFTAKRCRGGHAHNYNVHKLPADIREKIPGTCGPLWSGKNKMLTRIDRMIASPWCDRVCWTVIGMAIAYFGPVCIRILAR
jgi:hypothetical protein